MPDDTSIAVAVDLPLPDSPLPHAKLSEGNKQPHFYAIRKVLDCMNATNTDIQESIMPNLYSRLNALEADSLYWAPEVFQYKLMPFIRNLTFLLNEKFEANGETEVAWSQFLVNWNVANMWESAPISDKEPIVPKAPTEENTHSTVEALDIENSSTPLE